MRALHENIDAWVKANPWKWSLGFGLGMFGWMTLVLVGFGLGLGGSVVSHVIGAFMFGAATFAVQAAHYCSRPQWLTRLRS